VLAAIPAASTIIRRDKMSSADPVNKIKPNLSLKEPPLFKVIYLNDEHTAMEFVVSSLVEYFNYNPDTATQITHDVHENGSAVVAILPYEVAEQRGIEVTLDARAQGYPLQVKVEAEA
jgi:ATP-dependent Clp protease adaptor protein ClpS